MSIDKALAELLRGIKSGKITKENLEINKEIISKKHKLNRLVKNAEILEFSNFDKDVVNVLKIKPVRTKSGVSVIALMTKPYPCPGKCIYCPTAKGAPKSYTGVEPAALRAKMNDFDPIKQIKSRLRQFDLIGHPSDKCEIIIMGGTFLAMPSDYKEWFAKSIFDALNGTTSSTLEEAKKKNETATHRCVGLTVETRPDYCHEEHIREMLRYGATRVELGVQSTDDSILKAVKRGHDVKETVSATKLSKDSALKVCYHMMPGLTGLVKKNLKKEYADFMKIFEDESFRPDLLKIYPTLVIPGTELYEMWKRGEYNPLTIDETIDLLIKIKTAVPKWVRIQRIQRDISSKKIVAGPNMTNLRQKIHEIMNERGLKCNCIRCREIGRHPEDIEKTPVLNVVKYRASEGTEYFISFETENAIWGLLRLRIPGNPFISPLDRKTGLIRELHVFGSQVRIGESSKGDAAQHKGLGRALVKKAEEIAKDEGMNSIAIISGIGVREYYRKLGYSLRGHYMWKELD